MKFHINNLIILVSAVVISTDALYLPSAKLYIRKALGVQNIYEKVEGLSNTVDKLENIVMSVKDYISRMESKQNQLKNTFKVPLKEFGML